MRLKLIVAISLALVACEKKKEPLKPADPPPMRSDVTYLTPAQHLIRISLDLRGTRPTIEEIAAIEADPSDDHMRKYIRAWMQDPRFRERVKEIWNEGFLTRQDRPYFPGAPELRSFITQDEFAKASGNEPLELIAHVVIHYFSDDGFADTDATVKIWVNGTEEAELERNLVANQLWDVGVLDWTGATGQFGMVDSVSTY